MKSDKVATPKSKNAKSNDNNKKEKVIFNDASATATEKAKPRAGRGLANEGTVVSYDEER